jgi:hypothetical protein
VSSRVLQLSVTLAIGLTIGVLVGRWTAPPPATEAAATSEQATDAGPDIVSELAKSIKNIDLTGVEKGLTAVSEIIAAVSVSDILDWGRAPENVSRRIINEMSDDELISTITSVTTITADELAEISDLRDYANRLTHIAMSGVITPDIADTFGHDTLEVEFSIKANKSSGADDPRDEFEADARRIYAVIPNNENSTSTIMVHWYRIDQPEILLFDRYRVSPADNYSYVWLKGPSGPWPSGEYRAEFYSANEDLAPIASGTYWIKAD